VDLRRVVHGHDHVALGTAEAHLRDRGRAVGEQPLAVGGIGPGACDYLGAVEWADVGLVVIDDGVHELGIDESLLNQKRLERLDTHGWIVGHAGSR
jgi:hypothetical protein